MPRLVKSGVVLLPESIVLLGDNMELFSLPETAQEVFDIVAKHLLTQNAKSSQSDKICQYRSSDGKVCAAGCLIPDEHYNPRIENCDWNELVDQYYFPKNHRNLIYDLQGIHDGCPVSFWKEKLKNLADDYKLNSDVLKGF